MGLKEYNEEDGIVTDYRREHHYFDKRRTENNEEWRYVYLKIIDEEVMEWPALSYDEAQAKVFEHEQPGTGSMFLKADWEMMEEQREVGSYILTRTSRKIVNYFMFKEKMEQPE